MSVAKAAKPAQVAVYDQAGNLVGLCDPEEIIPVANPGTADVAKARRQAPQRRPGR